MLRFLAYFLLIAQVFGIIREWNVFPHRDVGAIGQNAGTISQTYFGEKPENASIGQIGIDQGHEIINVIPATTAADGDDLSNGAIRISLPDLIRILSEPERNQQAQASYHPSNYPSNNIIIMTPANTDGMDLDDFGDNTAGIDKLAVNRGQIQQVNVASDRRHHHGRYRPYAPAPIQGPICACDLSGTTKGKETQNDIGGVYGNYGYINENNGYGYYWDESKPQNDIGTIYYQQGQVQEYNYKNKIRQEPPRPFVGEEGPDCQCDEGKPVLITY